VYYLNLEEEFYKELDKFLHEYLRINPIAATYLGIHKYDHLLPKGGWDGFNEEERFLHKFRDWLYDFIKNVDFSETSLDFRIDVDMLWRQIRLWEFQIYKWRIWAKYPSAPDNISTAIFLLFGRDFAPYEERLKSIASRLELSPIYLSRSRELLIEPVKMYIDIGIEIARQIPPSIDFIINYSEIMVGENEYIDKMVKASSKLKEEVEDFISWLDEVRKDADEEYRIGKELFDEMINIRELGYTSDDILKLGEKYLRHFKSEAVKLSKMITGSENIKKTLEKLESKHPKDFDDIIDTYKRDIERARKFVIENKIAPIPPGESIKVLETPPYMAPIIPFAAYIGPAPFEDRKEGIYLVTRPSREEEYRRHNIYSISNTTVHEAYPGHHLQLAWSATKKNLARLISVDTAFIEGWAHYCEDLMKEYGYDDTPEHRFIQVIDSIWRAVRVIIDVKLSRGDMEFDEAVDFLVNETGMDREAAISEVKRYALSPGYQLSYLIGRHLFNEIRKEIKRIFGDRYSDYEFNRVILESCGIPFKYMKEYILHKIKI